jgi:hypothetical protein
MYLRSERGGGAGINYIFNRVGRASGGGGARVLGDGAPRLERLPLLRGDGRCVDCERALLAGGSGERHALARNHLQTQSYISGSAVFNRRCSLTGMIDIRHQPARQ